MPSAATRPLTSVKAAVITMNPHEAGAVMDAAEAEGWTKTGECPDALGAAGFQVREFHSPNGQFTFDHIDLNNSGNLVAAMLAERFFSTNDMYDAVIMFGCAGMNRGAAQSLGLDIGSVVLVEKAQYAENGRVYVDNYPANERVERVSIKGDRFWTWRVELSSGLTRRLGRVLGLPYVSALCVDKILQIDPAVGLTQPPCQPMEYSYTDLLSTSKYHIVDMESFGFLWALGTRTRNTAVIRVLTDELSTHQQSTVGSSPGSDSKYREGDAVLGQEELLRQHAPVVLRAIEGFPTTSDEESHIGPPRIGELTAEEIQRELSDVLFDSVSLVALASGSPAMGAKQFLSWVRLLPSRTDAGRTGGSDPNLGRWISDLAITSEFGYGTHSLARRTLDLTSDLGDLIEPAVEMREDRRSQLEPTQIEPLRRSDYREHLLKFARQLAREVDPASGLSRYGASVRMAIKRLGFRGLVVRSGREQKSPWAQITYAYSKTPLLTLTPEADRVSGQSPKSTWRGWEDDDDLRQSLDRALSK